MFLPELPLVSYPERYQCIARVGMSFQMASLYKTAKND
jgi:hypothetical protein